MIIIKASLFTLVLGSLSMIVTYLHAKILIRNGMVQFAYAIYGTGAVGWMMLATQVPLWDSLGYIILVTWSLLSAIAAYVVGQHSKNQKKNRLNP